jgi:hypothetical protein
MYVILLIPLFPTRVLVSLALCLLADRPSPCESAFRQLPLFFPGRTQQQQGTREIREALVILFHPRAFLPPDSILTQPNMCVRGCK